MAFKVYKPGQGKYTRLGSVFAAAAVVGLGCLQLYNKLQAAEWGLGPKATLWIATMVPAGLFIILTALSFWLVNKPVVSDFMISAEGEMKKVSWSSRKEIAVSTFVVIMVVIIMGVLLGSTDLIFQLFFSWLL